jgi:DNA-binding Xre family transcriptional regulator
MADQSFDSLLRDWMTAAQIATWQQLSDRAGMSLTKLRKLRRGDGDRLKLSELQHLSQALQIPLGLLLAKLGVIAASKQPGDDRQEFQLASIQIIESFLTYWPAAAHQVQLNPEFPASKLLPLVKPIERLLASWDVRPMDPVGATVAFNPQYHQAMTGQIPAGEAAIVRYPGYLQGDKLLWRAQVSRP